VYLVKDSSLLSIGRPVTPSHCVMNSARPVLALGEVSSRRACVAIISGSLRPCAAAAENSSASGMLAVNRYERRDAIS